MRVALHIKGIFACIVLLSTTAKAQILPALGCNDKTIRLQAEQIKQDFKAQGQEVFKDAMISMESRQPSPIAIHLTKGVLYQMVFIGSKEANRINFELYDGNDTKIDERILKHPAITNFLIYSFVPEKTDLYLIILSQSKGVKNLCGSFTILQPSAAKTKPNTPATKQPAKTTQPNKTTTNPRYNPNNK